MLNNVINLVVNFLKEHFPNLRYRDGAIYDLFVKAFSLLFKQEIDKVNALLAGLDIRNYATMTEAELDRCAAFWFVSRVTGAKASTRVRVELTAAVKVEIPVGFAFATVDGYKFLVTEARSFSAAQIAATQVGDIYYFDVPVQAEEEGTEYNVSVGEISSIASAFYAPVYRVTNLTAATSGANRETNTELYMRLVRSVNTRSLLITPNSIYTMLMAVYPTLRDVNVACKGDTLMQRDRIYDAQMPGGLSPYETSNYWGKRAGIIRFNKNIARDGRMMAPADIPTTTLADVEDAVVEVEQADYYDIYGLDLEYMITRGGLEYFDDFEDNQEWSSINPKRVQDIENWIATDSGFEFGTRKYGNSISIFNGWLCLGITNEALSPIEGA